MLINVKMPTLVGILTFMSMINSMLSCVEHKMIYYLMPDMTVCYANLINDHNQVQVSL